MWELTRKGNFVITYRDRNGEKKTVTLAKASDLDKSPMIGTAQYEGVLYWRQTKDNGATWEWITDKDGDEVPVFRSRSGRRNRQGRLLDSQRREHGVLAKDMTGNIFKNIAADSESGLVVFSLTDGSSFSVRYNESLAIAFTTPSFLAVESYSAPVEVGYNASAALWPRTRLWTT